MLVCKKVQFDSAAGPVHSSCVLCVYSTVTLCTSTKRKVVVVEMGKGARIVGGPLSY